MGLPETHLFIPYMRGPDGRDCSFYDTPAFWADLPEWFEPLALSWTIHRVHIDTINQTVDLVSRRPDSIVFNLCDGDEVHGYPGLSVVNALEARRIPFTGAGSAFYDLTTYKVRTKERLLARGVETSPFLPLIDLEHDTRTFAEQVGFPAIIKPNVSAGSMGIGAASVVHSEQEARTRAKQLLLGLHGIDFSHTGIFAERFLSGDEYTVFVIADRDTPGGVCAYPPVQRLFHPSLPPEERILAFERYWTVLELDIAERLDGVNATPPPTEWHYRYVPVPQPLVDETMQLAIRAFSALDGTGYARVDMRRDIGGKLYVLEVNANCGISGTQAESSVGEVLRLHGGQIHELVGKIIEEGLTRSGAR